MLSNDLSQESEIVNWIGVCITFSCAHSPSYWLCLRTYEFLSCKLSLVEPSTLVTENPDFPFAKWFYWIMHVEFSKVPLFSITHMNILAPILSPLSISSENQMWAEVTWKGLAIPYIFLCITSECPGALCARAGWAAMHALWVSARQDILLPESPFLWT